MPRIRQIDRWNEDPEYSALPAPEKQAILENYFDKNLADSNYQNLPSEERSSIRRNFSSYHMPTETPAPPPGDPQPEETMREQVGRLGARTGEVAAAGLKGAAEGLTTELPGMVGGAMEFVGAGLPGDITETMRETTEELGGDPSRVPDFSFDTLKEVGKDLGDWAEAKKLQWFGPPKKREGLERVVYEGSKMLAPSILPGAIVGKGIKALSGVGKLVKASKAAQIAGNVARATELMDKANKAAGMANNIASIATASMFGLSQAQQTKDTAEEQADHLESQGKFEEAKKVRAQGQGFAPVATGSIEAGGEYFGTKYLGKLFRLDEAGVAKRGAKNLVKDFLKTLGVEVSTEVGQQLGEARIEQVTGIRPEADPIAEALDVVGPTVFMTLITGGLSGAIDTTRQSTDSINILDEAQEDVAPEKEAVDVNLIKRKLKEFREEATGPPTTAEEAADVFIEREAEDRHQLQRLGLQVPRYLHPAERSAQVFEEQPPVEAEAITPRTAQESAKTLVGPEAVQEAVQEEQERERIGREGLPVPEEAGREQIERLGLRVPEIKPAEEAARVFEEEPPATPVSTPTALAEKDKIPETGEIDTAANEAATSPLNAVPQPTEAQKEAGNYLKGKVSIQGIDISIENPKGSVRSGKDSDGETWETKMKSHYGYIKGTVGKDKDHLDIFIGDHPDKDTVYVVDQINPDTGEFDEHKVLIGFKSMITARKGYRENYEKGWKGLGAITKMPVEEFKEWAGDKDKTKIPLKYKEKKGVTPITTPVETPKEGSPETRIAERMSGLLEDKDRIVSSRDLFAIADEEFGGTQAEGNYTPKDAYDAMELGVNRLIAKQKINTSADNTIGQARKTVTALRDTVNRLPTQTRRTAETEEYQQFSTPPHLAYLANWVANVQKGESYLEPSAGIGGLAIFGKNAGADVVVNELSERRRGVLKNLGFDNIHAENAEQLDNILPKSVKPSVVVMNPPFSATAGRLKKTSSVVGFRHVEQALRRLEPNGRLVAILGKGVTDTSSFNDWWKNLKDIGIIKADIGIPGTEFKKYGTTYGNQLLVIDKVVDTGQEKITGDVANIEEAINLLKGVRDERITRELAPAKPEGEGLPPTRGPGARPVDIAQPTTGAVGVGERGARGTLPDRGDVEGVVEREPIGVDEGVTPAKPGQPGRDIQPTGREEQPGRPGVVDTGQVKRPVESGVSIGKGTGQKRVKQKALSGAIYESYEPQKVKIPGAGKHPGALVESAAMSAVAPPDPTYTPNLPKEIIKKNKLSLAQLEAIVYAGQAHSALLPSGERRGFFIGDGTGVGKGREIAGIILDNWRQGKGNNKAVWISQNAPLVEDAGRDVEGIGWDNKLLIDVGKKVKLGGEIKAKEGVAFLGYGLLTSKDTKNKDITRLNQLIDWLGTDFDGVIVFDESHNLGNALATKGKRGMTKPSERAITGVELQRLLPDARIVYVSATGATEVKNLAYADRLGLWGEGTAFANKQDFVEKITSGGIAAMELVARDMKAMGSYLARSLSYEGIKYDKMRHKLSPEQRSIYDEYSQAWQVVLRDVEAALGVADASGRAKGSARAQFWGSLQRFFNQVITSMQTPSVINAIENDIKAGHSAVIQLVNTNASIQDRAVGKLEKDQELEEADITPREILMSYVTNSFPVTQFQEEMDENGNIKRVPVLDSLGNPVENAQAVAMREGLLDKLGSIRGIDNPLDMIINHFGTKQVAEVTGRTMRLVSGKGGKLIKEKRSKSKTMVDADAFMNDKKQVLIFSNAGGTGRSYHASLDAKNQRLRRHYLLQAGWQADRAIQGFGRTHRSNQAQTPEYILVTTDVAGQKRFISSIARRLSQLGALTKGQRETGSGGFFDARDNLESAYAYDALVRLVQDIFTGDVPGMDFATFIDQSGLYRLRDDETGRLNVSAMPPVTQFLNRMLAMSIDNQTLIFDEFSKRIDQNVHKAMEAGTLDVGMETLKGKNITIADEQTVYTDENTGAETKYVALDVTKDAKILDFASIPKPIKSGGYYVNNKSGKVWAAGGLITKTDPRTGSLATSRKLTNPSYTSHAVERSIIEDPKRYKKIDAKEAQKIWDVEYAKLPKTITFREHMITGALLPIWDRLPTEATRIIRAQTDKGERMIGRLINNKNLDSTLMRLGAQSSKEKVSPEDLFHKVIDQGFKAALANGWRIERRRVSGEHRIELIGPGLEHTRELARRGVFSERINWVTRHFIPTSENGIDTIKAVTSNRPVISVEAPVSAKEDVGEVGEEPTKEQYSIAEEGKVPPVDRTIDIIESVFPGQEIKENETGIEVTFKNGVKVQIDRTENIKPEPKRLAAWGMKELGEGDTIAGVYIRKGGKTAQIKIVSTAGKHTLHHESIHLLEDFGIITKLEAGRINRHIRQKGQWNESITGAENRANWLAEEANKPAPTSKLGKLWAKIKTFVDNLVNKMGIRTVGGITREIKTGKIYEKEATPGATPSEQYAVKRTDTPTEESEEQPGLLRRQWDELVYNQQNRFNYLNKAQMEAESRKRSELPKEQNAYFSQKRYPGISAAAVEDFVEEYEDPIIDIMGKNDIDITHADEYLHARHARETNARLKKINPDKANNESLSGMSDEVAMEILAQAAKSPQSAAYYKLGEMVDRVTQAHRDILRESGLESRETIQAWEDTYDYYVALMREGKSENKMPRKGKGFQVTGKQKIRAGSTRRVVNILAHTVANTKAAIIRAEKVKVARTFLEFARNNPGPWEIDKVEYVPSFDANGLIQFRQDSNYRDADNVMIVKEGGINHRIVFDESNLNAMRIVSSLKNLNASDSGAIVRILSKVMRWLAIVNTGANIEFLFTNPIRDIGTAFYNMSDSEADAVKWKTIREIPKAWKGMRQFQKGNKDTEWAKLYDRFRKAGGKTGWLQDYSYSNVQEYQSDLEEKLKSVKGGKALTIKRGLKGTVKFIENMNDVGENGLRVSLFKNLVKNGVPEEKAAVIVKDVTVDFNEKGAKGQLMGSMYLFYNASIGGTARIFKAATKSAKVRKLMAGTVVFAAGLDMLNRAVGGVDDDGEDRYDKIQDWAKERNMIMMFPDSSGYAQLALPWGYNVLHVIGQVIGEQFTKKDADPLEGAMRIAGATISSFNPVGGEASIAQVISPTLTDPIIQWGENKDWAGRKLRPDSNVFAPKPSSQTYWNSVREPSRIIAEKINELTGGDVIKPGKIDISPEAIDLAIDTFTGGAGKFLGNLVSAPIKIAKGEELESYEIPILRRVYGRIGKQALTSEFYENMDSVQLVKRQLEHFQGDKKKLKEITTNSSPEKRSINRMMAAKKSLTALRKLKKSVENIKNKKMREKRLKSLNEKIKVIMNNFNKHYKKQKRKE